MATRQNEESLQSQDLRFKPWITIIILAACVYTYMQVASNGISYAYLHAFKSEFYFRLFSHGKLAFDLLPRFWNESFWTTFCQFNAWQMVFDVYFLWLFGSTIEARIGNLRFLICTALLIFSSWLILGYYLGPISKESFIGPTLFTFGLIGGYLTFAPERQIRPTGMIPSRLHYINRERFANEDHAGISPMVVIFFFFIYHVALVLFAAKLRLPFTFMKLVPAMCNMLVGYVVVLISVLLTTPDHVGNPLERLTIQRYKQLRRLDMTHDQAVAGAAKLLSIPHDQAKFWISQSEKR